jgi:hypothetical protein
MMAWLTGFARFWYRFFVGDDWLIAAGIVVALAATYGLSLVMSDTWWIVPSVALILLAVSVARAARPSK